MPCRISTTSSAEIPVDNPLSFKLGRLTARLKTRSVSLVHRLRRRISRYSSVGKLQPMCARPEARGPGTKAQSSSNSSRYKEKQRVDFTWYQYLQQKTRCKTTNYGLRTGFPSLSAAGNWKLNTGAQRQPLLHLDHHDNFYPTAYLLLPRPLSSL